MTQRGEATSTGLELGRQAVAGAAADLRVNPENVLAVRNAIKAEADELGDLMVLYGEGLHIEPLGADPVSYYATPVFNSKLRAFSDQCYAYIEALREVAEQLSRTARGYGFTEQQINESFDVYQQRNPRKALS